MEWRGPPFWLPCARPQAVPSPTLWQEDADTLEAACVYRNIIDHSQADKTVILQAR